MRDDDRSIPKTAGLERILHAVSVAVLGLEDPALPTLDDAGAPARIGRMLSDLPKDQLRLLGLGTWVLDVLSILRRGRRFRNLAPDRARAVLAFLARSPFPPLRRLHAALRMLAAFAYFSGEGSFGITGYDGPWIGRVDVLVRPPPSIPVDAST